MNTDFGKNLVKLMMALLLCVVAIGASVFAFLHNYQGFSGLFELLNFDTKAIADDALIGWAISGIPAEATNGHWIALTAATLIFGLALVAAHIAFKLVQLAIQWNMHRRLGQRALAAAAVHVFLGDLVVLCVVAPLLALLLWAEFKGLQYRALAGSMGLEDGLKAAGGIPSLNHLGAAQLSLFSTELLSMSLPMMSLALSVAAPILCEYSMQKAGTFAGRLAGEGVVAQPAQSAQETHYGYDAQGVPVMDPATPIAYDVNQNPVGQAASTGAQSSAAEQTTQAEAACVAPKLRAIGSFPVQEVTLAEALADTQRFHVDQVARKVWDRHFYESLHDESPVNKSD